MSTTALFAASTNIYFHLPVLIVVISLVYSATRFEHWPNIFSEALRWGCLPAAWPSWRGSLSCALRPWVPGRNAMPLLVP